MKKILSMILVSLFLCGAVTASTQHGTFEGDPIIQITSNGEPLEVEDVPAILYKNRTMVPVYLLRQLGVNVTWDKGTQTVDVMLPGKEVDKVEKPFKRVLSDSDIDELKSAVAYIEALDDKGNTVIQGSGFIINDRGLLITNHHVATIDGEPANLRVEVNGETYQTNGNYVFMDEQKDLFGVYLDGNGFDYLEMSTELPEVGDEIIVIGNPEGERSVVSKGKISSSFDSSKGGWRLGYTAETRPGNSGSPVIDIYGQVVGMHNIGDGIIHGGVSINTVQEAYATSFNQ